VPLLFSFTAHFPYLYRNPNQSEQWKQLTAICRGPFELNGVSYVFTGNVVSTGLHHGIVAKLDERGGQGTIQCSLEQLKEMRVPRARASSAILPLNTGNQGGSTNRPAGHGAASGGNKSSSSSSSSSRNGGGTAKTSPARPATRTSQRSINALRSSNGSEDRGDEEEDRPGGGGGGRGEGDGPHGSGKKKKKTLSKAKRIRDDEDAGDNSDDDDDEPTTKKSRPNYGLGVPRSDPLKTPSPKKQPPSAVAQQRRSSVGRGGKDSQVAQSSKGATKGGEAAIAPENGGNAEGDTLLAAAADDFEDTDSDGYVSGILKSTRKSAQTPGPKAALEVGTDGKNAVEENARSAAATGGGGADSTPNEALTQPVTRGSTSKDGSLEEQKAKVIADGEARMRVIHQDMTDAEDRNDEGAAETARVAGHAEAEKLRAIKAMTSAEFKTYQGQCGKGSELEDLEAEIESLKSELQLKVQEESDDLYRGFDADHRTEVLRLKKAIGALQAKIDDANAVSAATESQAIALVENSASELQEEEDLTEVLNNLRAEFRKANDNQNRNVERAIRMVANQQGYVNVLSTLQQQISQLQEEVGKFEGCHSEETAKIEHFKVSNGEVTAAFQDMRKTLARITHRDDLTLAEAQEEASNAITHYHSGESS
jgi:hypothetical protein